MRKDKTRKLFKGAFIARMPNGHQGVFRRSKKSTKFTKGRPSTSSPNLKIYELYGPNVQGIFAEKTDDIIRVSDGVLIKNLNREINFALRKK